VLQGLPFFSEIESIHVGYKGFSPARNIFGYQRMLESANSNGETPVSMRKRPHPQTKHQQNIKIGTCLASRQRFLGITPLSGHAQFQIVGRQQQILGFDV